jgi:hypothetical protein
MAVLALLALASLSCVDSFADPQIFKPPVRAPPRPARRLPSTLSARAFPKISPARNFKAREQP